MSDELQTVLLALLERHEQNKGFPFMQLPLDMQRLLFFDYFLDDPEIIGSISRVCSTWKTWLYNQVHISVWAPTFWGRYECIIEARGIANSYTSYLPVNSKPVGISILFGLEEPNLLCFLDRLCYFHRFIHHLPDTRKLGNMLALVFYAHRDHAAIASETIRVMELFAPQCEFDINYLVAVSNSMHIGELLSKTPHLWRDELIDLTKGIHRFPGQPPNAKRLLEALLFGDRTVIYELICDGVWLESEFNTHMYYQAWLKGIKLGNRDWKRIILAYKGIPSILFAMQDYLSVYKPRVYAQEFYPLLSQLLAGKPKRKREVEETLGV